MLTRNPTPVDIKPFIYEWMNKKQGQDLGKVALTLNVHGKPASEGRTSSSKSIYSSLDRHYFGSGRALSEGGGDNLYLIDNQDKFHKIEVDKHSTDTKRFWGGRRIVEEEHFGFGPRTFPFDVSEVGDAGGRKPLDNVRSLLNLLKQQSKDELKQLSKFLDDRTDDQLCEVLDVFWECWIAKQKFVGAGKTLQDEIDFKLEVVSTELAKVKLEGELPSKDEWEAFAAIFKDMVKFNKLRSFQGQVAKYGMAGAKSELSQASSNSNEKGEERGKQSQYDNVTNPVQFWIGVIKNEKLGFDCSQEDHTFKKFFEECRKETMLKSTLNEAYKTTHVIKSGYKGGSPDRRTYRISKKDGGGRGRDQHEMRPDSDEGKEFLRHVSKKLLIDGIVEEDCQNLSGGGFGFLSIEQRFCREVNRMFFGDTVNEKRFCRYEIPNARGYLRATPYI